jgi:antitoxin CcdA
MNRRATAMMSDRPVKKRAVNLFVDSELLDHARRMGINISETLEHRLRSLVRMELERQWLEDNKEAIAQYNRRVAEHGLLSDHAGLL